jgi:hypothetical protein
MRVTCCLHAGCIVRPVAGESGASIVIDRVIRVQVRSYGLAGEELMVELERLAPNIIGLPIVLEDGVARFHAVVKEEREQDGRTVVLCALREHLAGERGAFG